MLVDTHCHIHSILGNPEDHTTQKWHDGGVNDPDKVIKQASGNGVDKLICVGTDIEDSKNAIDFVKNRDNCWATVGIHPHEAQQFLHTKMTKQGSKLPAPSSLSAHRGVDDSSAPSLYQPYSSVRTSSSPSAASEYEKITQAYEIKELINSSKVVAIGEIGLDYYRENSPKSAQITLLEQLLQIAQDTGLPVIFHVRDAYEDFWPIFDNFTGVKGVLHSFSADMGNLNQALKRDLFVGFNGIMTFTKDRKQLEVAKAAPVEKILLETDSPYLTPVPYRGTICSPSHIKTICEFLCNLRGGELEEFATQTTKNAQNLFNIN